MADSTKWTKRLSTPASALTASVLTAETRKRGVTLIIASLATILVSEGIANISEGSLGGIKFTPSKLPALVAVAGLVCLYLLLLYLIDAYRDWRANRYILLPAMEELDDLSEETNEFLKNKRSSMRSKNDELQELFQRRTAKVEELKKLSAAGADPKIISELKSDFTAYCQKYGFDDLFDEIMNLSVNVTYTERMKQINSTRSSRQILSRCQLTLEVIFPTGLALYAIQSACRYVLFH